MQVHYCFVNRIKYRWNELNISHLKSIKEGEKAIARLSIKVGREVQVCGKLKPKMNKATFVPFPFIGKKVLD